jgi:hypothetical protein
VGGSDSAVHVLYDPRVSENGAVRSLGRQAKRADVTDAGIAAVGHIIAPHALPMFREDKARTTAKQKRRDRADPVKSNKPDLGPVAAIQKGLAYPGTQTSRRSPCPSPPHAALPRPALPYQPYPGPGLPALACLAWPAHPSSTPRLPAASLLAGCIAASSPPRRRDVAAPHTPRAAAAPRAWPSPAAAT